MKHSSALLLLLPAALLAQEAAAPPPADSLSLWGMIAQGGWAMYPLGTCSLAMLFLIFYSWRETAPARFFTREQVDGARKQLGAEASESAADTLGQAGNVLGRALGPALRQLRGGSSPAQQEKAGEAFIDRLEAEENGIGQWIVYLNVVAAVAPMIGLLGTVSGMISAFQTIGRGGMGRPELLAGDIGEALITTATGLVIGIPAMIAYFVLRNRLNNAMIATTQAGNELLETAAGEEVER